MSRRTQGVRRSNRRRWRHPVGLFCLSIRRRCGECAYENGASPAHGAPGSEWGPRSLAVASRSINGSHGGFPIPEGWICSYATVSLVLSPGRAA